MRHLKTATSILLSMLFCTIGGLYAQETEFSCDDEVEENECPCEPDYYFPPPNKFTIAPLFYHLQRTREGGTKQDGWIYGVAGSYDRIKRYRLYWGLDASYAKGNLSGHTGTDDPLKSTYTDERLEGRFGYTFQAKCAYTPSFTPYVGYGYIRTTNKFHAPSPMELKFLTTLRYAAYGFLSSITPMENITIGFNFKGWTPIHARTKVQDDPDEDDASMLMGDRFNYRIELPLCYRYDMCDQVFEFGISPFYEQRHYGSRENFPFNFFDTKFRFWGFSLLFTYRI